MTDLLITNGDSAAHTLRGTALAEGAVVLPWRDALHWGEIPDRADLAGVSDIRARAMHRLMPGRRPARIRAEFRERDGTLLGHSRFDAIALWFEHDLYDQLQLVQILHVLHGLGRMHGVTLVQADDYLGRMPGNEVARIADRAVPVTGLTLTEATLAWEALTAPTPAPVFDMVRSQSCFLPYLCPALARWLEDLPDASGLSRSERQILALVAETEGSDTPLGQLFAPCLAREEAEFEGDLGFLCWVQGLALGPEPLVTGLADPMLPDPSAPDPSAPGAEDAARRVWQSRLSLTGAGRAVLAGRADHVALNGIDRWWAGTRLRPGAVWRWIDGTLVAPS